MVNMGLVALLLGCLFFFMLLGFRSEDYLKRRKLFQHFRELRKAPAAEEEIHKEFMEKVIGG